MEVGRVLCPYCESIGVLPIDAPRDVTIEVRCPYCGNVYTIVQGSESRARATFRAAARYVKKLRLNA